MNIFDDVKAFRVLMGQPCPERPIEMAEYGPSIGDVSLGLVVEEFNEWSVAKTPADEVDALIDLIYVSAGRLIALGVDGDAVWELVHVANMAKADGPVREDGKRLKPPGWTHPDIAAELDRQRAGV